MYISNLDKKIIEVDKPRTIPTICSWSDLLGFSTPYVESNWSPNDTQYNEIAYRLKSVQTICARNLFPGIENVIVSNDAFMRNLNFESITHLDYVSMWFRGLVFFHMQTNSFEKANKLPGIRTVVAGGERLIHSFEDVQFEDYVYNYTKKDPEGNSSFPKSIREKTVMYNPSAFQMNTGFSKSYILDSLGSKCGLSGNSLYIDESVLCVIKSNLGRWGVSEDCFVVENTESGIKVYISKPETERYYLGFDLSNPIAIESDKIKTTVYKMLGFYPWDEDPRDFRISLHDDMGYFIEPYNI